MKISKIMLILFILLAILTATAVSATEDAENMTAQAPLDEIESSDAKTVMQTDEEEQLEEKTDINYNLDWPDEIIADEKGHEVSVRLHDMEAKGNITISINDEPPIYNKEVSHVPGEYNSLSLDDVEFKKGQNKITVAYTGDENYNPFSRDLFVTYFDYRFNIEYDDSRNIKFIDEVIFDMSLPAGVTNPVTVKYGNRTYYVPIDRFGRGEITLTDFKVGKSNITFSYEDEKHPLIVKNITIYANPVINIDGTIEYNGTDGFLFMFPDATGKLKIYKGIYNESKKDYDWTLNDTVPFECGAVIYPVNWTIGRYNVKFAYDGDDYREFIDENKIYAINVVPGRDMPTKIHYGDGAQLKIILPDDSSEKLVVGVYAYGLGDYKEILFNGTANGTVTLNLNKSMEVGEYIIKTQYGKIEFSKEITVTNSSRDFDLNVTFPKIAYVYSTNYFEANVPHDADGNLTLFINGENVGVWREFDDYYEIPAFKANSTNTWEVKFAGDKYYSNYSLSGTFENRMVEIPEVTDLSGHFNIDIENHEGILIFLIDGKQVFNDFFKNSAWVPFENLTVGNHTYEIILYDTSNHLVFDENGTFYAVYELTAFVMNSYPLSFFIEIPVRLPDDATYRISTNYDGEEDFWFIKDGFANIVLEPKIGNHTITITYPGNDKYPQKSIQKFFSVEGYEIGIYELYRTVIGLQLPSDAKGKLDVYAIDEKTSAKTLLESVDFNNGSAIYVPSFGNYLIHAEYTGTDYEVNPFECSLDILPDVKIADWLILGENTTLRISDIPEDDDFKIYLDGELMSGGEYEEEVKTFNVTGLTNLGEHKITVWYNGIQMNKDSRPFEVKFTVVPGTFALPQQFGFDMTANMTVNLSEYAKGNISVIARDASQEYVFAQNVSVSGNATVKLSAEKPGSYWLSIIYVDENYGKFRTSALAYVPKPDAGAGMVIPEKVASDTLEINLPKNATGSLLAIIDGESRIYKLIDGSAKLDLSAISAGSHNIVLKYAGDENYETFEKTASLIMLSNPKLDVKTDVDGYGSVKVTATAEKNATGNVTITIIDAVTGETVDNDVGELLDGSYVLGDIGYTFKKGKYNVTVAYGGDDNYYAKTVNGNFTIDKEIISPKTTQLDVDGGEINVTVDLGVNATGVVHVVYPSGYVDNATINDGKVNFNNVFIKETGPITLVLDYDGDDNYFGFFEYFIDFTIKKATFVTAKPISVVYKNNAQWTINLKDAELKAVAGQTIKVTLNGKTYTAVTDAKGNAVVTIPANMVPNGYTAKIVFEGTALLSDDFENVKFTVKKATPKLAAKKKTFKAKTKVKKYAIVLKDHKKKVMKKAKVYIKVKGKTYKATTNNKGKAVFKIKNLKKKGTYKAKVTFKATKYFNKVAKTVKIKVKR